MLKVKLNKNLRKTILQGNPWVYRDSISQDKLPQKAELVQINDQKNKFLGWGSYDPNSPLALRVFSTHNIKPNLNLKIQESINHRSHLITNQNTIVRLINGEGDLLPGLVVDLYGSTAVIQYDGDGMVEFWKPYEVHKQLLKVEFIDSVYYKPRHDSKNQPLNWNVNNTVVTAFENNIQFNIDIKNGQKTGFFIDQRDNRNYVKKISNNKSVLNLFSYTGGFSVYAGVGGARDVHSIDLSKDALELAEKNWKDNNLNNHHKSTSTDIFKYLNESKDEYDIVICDPPSLAKNERTKPQATQKYIEAFSLAARQVSPNGYLCLSSCSSHISFEDFFEIIKESLSKARKKGIVKRVSGQGEDHPFPHACPHLRYLKFVSLILN